MALSTTYARLDAALAGHAAVQIGRVTYVDYQSAGWRELPLDVLTPYTLKRASFEHERERFCTGADITADVVGDDGQSALPDFAR